MREAVEPQEEGEMTIKADKNKMTITVSNKAIPIGNYAYGGNKYNVGFPCVLNNPEAMAEAGYVKADSVVSVKPLEWERGDLISWGETASCFGKLYRLTWEYGEGPDGEEAFFTVRFDGVVLHSGWDEERAYEAAQADYKRRILSTLTTQPATKTIPLADHKAAVRDARNAALQEAADIARQISTREQTEGTPEADGLSYGYGARDVQTEILALMTKETNNE